MTCPVGIQLLEALRSAWVEAYGQQPRGVQWSIGRLTMELNAARDKARKEELLLKEVVASLSAEGQASVSTWLSAIELHRTPPTAGDLWDLVASLPGGAPGQSFGEKVVISFPSMPAHVCSTSGRLQHQHFCYTKVQYW